VRGAIDEQYFRVFDGLDEVRRRRALGEAGRVSKPPGFRRELKDVFLALAVNQVVAQAATGNERSVPDDVAGTLEKSPRRDRTMKECPADDFELTVGEGRTRL
jgi:hypothetical protein